MQVSVTIIARDAENTLFTCLSGVKNLTDDIIVVIDDRTTDDTATIARGFGAKVFHRKFVNFSDQHNFADFRTKHDWVLSLDADETASPQLAKEIKELDDNLDIPAFWIPRKNKIFGKIINHSNWDPDGIIRLYNKNIAHWEGEVHEGVKFAGVAGNLKGWIFHDNYRSVDEFISRQNNYSSLEAEKMYKQGARFNTFSLLWAPVYDFGRRYIWHAGFLDGWHGLYLSYLMAIYHLTVWTKLWQLQNSPKE